MDHFAFMNNPPSEPFGFAQGPEPVEGRDVKHPVETVRLSSRPKAATMICKSLRLLFHESFRFAKNAG
jgi:hypothetical protein